MEQQITTFEEVYHHVNVDGVYLVEDTATSYMSDFGGGFRKPGTFIEFVKQLVDDVNGGWYSHATKITHSTVGIGVYDQMVVFERSNHPKPRSRKHGNMSMLYTPQLTNHGGVDPNVLAHLQHVYNKTPKAQ